jgi:bacteriorhodopsin
MLLQLLLLNRMLNLLGLPMHAIGLRLDCSRWLWAMLLLHQLVCMLLLLLSTIVRFLPTTLYKLFGLIGLLLLLLLLLLSPTPFLLFW